MNPFLALFEAEGHSRFADVLCLRNPLTKSIRPTFFTLRAGYAALEISTNQQNSEAGRGFSKQALCIAADLAAGVMMDVSVPTGARWSRRGMSVAYLDRTPGEITAVADGGSINWETSGVQTVLIQVKNSRSEVIATAEMTVEITPA